MFKVISPFEVRVSKNKTFKLNLNIYRNAHYNLLNNAKIKYKNLMENQIRKLPVFDYPIKLKIVFYPRTKLKFDVGNFGSIIEKFFLDALVEFQKLKDDTYEYCPKVIYEFGSVDKTNPRIEIIMSKFNIDTKIDINFTEEQIKNLLTTTVKEEMPNVAVGEINFIIKRNPTSVSATVDATMAGISSSNKKEVEEEKEVIKPTIDTSAEEVEVEVEEEVETAETNEDSNKVTDYLDLD